MIKSLICSFSLCLLFFTLTTSQSIAQTINQAGKISVSEDVVTTLKKDDTSILMWEHKGVPSVFLLGASHLDKSFYPYSDRLLRSSNEKETLLCLEDWEKYFDQNSKMEFGNSSFDLYYACCLLTYELGDRELAAKYFRSVFIKLIDISSGDDPKTIGKALKILQLLAPVSVHKKSSRWYYENFLIQKSGIIAILNAVIKNNQKQIDLLCPKGESIR